MPTVAEPVTLGDRLWKILRYLLIAGLILGGLAVAGFIALLLMLRSSYPEVGAVAAPVAWTTSEVQLTPQRPIAFGTLTLTASSVPSSGSRQVGLNAGAPSVAGTDELVDPVVRLAITGASGRAQTCLAPCEQAVSADFDCRGGPCTMVLHVTVELVRGPVARDTAVQLGISGGISAAFPEGRLPASLVLDLQLSGPADAS